MRGLEVGAGRRLGRGGALLGGHRLGAGLLAGEDEVGLRRLCALQLGPRGVERLDERRAGEPLAIDLLVERGARDRLGAVGRLGERELRAGVQLGRRAAVGAALRGERGVQLREAAFEVGGTARRVGRTFLQLRAHAGEVGADRGELALPRGDAVARAREIGGAICSSARASRGRLGGAGPLALGGELARTASASAAAR